ncbi:hypothetical protein ElyMa_002100900 [Elysia marginata]|uniref:Uncharacterized protein n=1 Tax=Elysia marginata TaxID=1093978 RepID=A0AAV4FE74_9GAST|nr:hypothetical protein ElyMa_002100900 [Elysia marginata]
MNCSLWSNAAEDIDKLPDHARMFKPVKSLNRKKSENPKIFDANGKFITNIDEIQTVIGKHFKDEFRDDQINDLEPFQGDARDLNNPITTNEVEKALARPNKRGLDSSFGRGLAPWPRGRGCPR